MLVHLGIRNFTTVEALDLELDSGLTIITGETGAGKSVVLDALGLALGDRSNALILRDEQRNAEISASFAVDTRIDAYDWLDERDLLEDNSDEVILRRVITPTGRSRAYINGTTVNIADLKYLGEQLVDLHNQHEHQSLLDKQSHQKLLDEFAGNAELLEKTRVLAKEWHEIEQQIQSIAGSLAARDSRLQLLNYQVQELDKLALEEQETSRLASEQKKLANAEQLLHNLDEAINCCDDDQGSGALALLRQAITQLLQQIDHLPDLKGNAELLESASIQVEEALGELNSIRSQLSIDPQRLNSVEQRLDQIYTIARKHHVEPNALAAAHQQLAEELATLNNSDAQLDALHDRQTALKKQFTTQARKLSQKRRASAKKLQTAVNQKLSDLNMAHCCFDIAVNAIDPAKLLPNGLDSIEFMVSTIPGKAPQALAKIASGGELSRISLAIQVVTAQTSDLSTLVFDEIDVGIGGSVAEVVGNLLRELSKSGQILCVTHLAQVAAKGDTHLLASKSLSKNSASTAILTLDKKGRTTELARMMGGLDVTKSTMAHAAEMLETA